MSEQLKPFNPEALKRCQLNLGCAARERCIAAPVRNFVEGTNSDVRIEQEWVELHAKISGEPLTLADNEIEEIEGYADFLEALKANLAKCGYSLLRLEAENHPESA